MATAAVSDRVTVVMYHYVHDLGRPLFPGLKALDVRRFAGQLAYLAKHYSIISMEHLVEAAHGERSLPRRPALLTFDDGYLDHYQYAFPLLDRLGLPASFYAPVTATKGDTVLDCNKIHLVLARSGDPKRLLADLFALLDELADRHSLPPNETYSVDPEWYRFDDPQTALFKNILQMELPARVRGIVLERLFAQYVSEDEPSVARNLYMDEEQLALLRRHGMHIGCHGKTHEWMQGLDDATLDAELDASLDLLARVGQPVEGWTMTYPHGVFDDRLVEAIRSRGCALGFTAAPGLFAPWQDLFAIPRLDTNDLPTDAAAAS